MAIKHAATATSGSRGYADDWNADHVIEDESKALRAATLIVAASDSLDKGRADYACDGVADQAEINTAIAALAALGGCVCLLEGTFHVTGSVNMASGVRLEGQGYGTVISRVTGTSAYNVFFLPGVSYASLSALRVLGNRTLAGSSLWGNVGLGGSHNSVAGCFIDSARGTGITVTGVSCTITGCFIDDTFLSGIFVNSAGPLLISSCFITNSGFAETSPGIRIVGTSAHVSVTGTTVSGGLGDGINLYNTAGHCIVMGCFLLDNAGTGYKENSASNDYNVVVGNTATGNAVAQITINGANTESGLNIVA